MKKILLFVLMTVSAAGAFAQRTDRSFVRKGNRLFEDSLFIKAEENYLKAVDVNPELYEGNYNLGNAYTAQQKPNEAVEQYRRTANALEARKKELAENPGSSPKELEKCKNDLAKTYHNTGVVYHMSERYDKAVEAYKEALRNNPQDDETRYNLILAQRMLQQQQQQQ
ncbi:MAG: tetratricopeptide repeat protein, partial [Bacteroidaceae bacterium]|nr:tetratricopeptide repeat protein [Bacteroidaceae bacterium]